MTPAVTMEELLAWDQESSTFWKAHLDANPALLELPCGIAVRQTYRSSSGIFGGWS